MTLMTFYYIIISLKLAILLVEREESRIVYFRKQASNFADLLMGMSYLQNVF